MLRLPMPEALLARLIASPHGMAPPRDDESASWSAARRELESRGHGITTCPDGTWSLDCRAAHFDPGRFETYRSGSFGTPLEVWERRDSTNPRAWEGAQAGMSPGWVVLAEEQEAGRGRQGRRWLCPPHGGLLFSLVAPAQVRGHPHPQLLPLALATAVCEALRHMTGRDIRLKWPNDLLLGERKLAGFLVEARPSMPSCVVAGCGINVRVPASFFAAHGLPAASLLAEDAPGPAREEILAEVLRGMENGLEAWQDGRAAAILEAWSALDALQGREVEAHLPQGVERGRALGLNEAGLLRLRLSSGEVRCLSAAEVHLR